MRKFVACALLGMAFMATASSGAERRPVRLVSLLQNSPTLLNHSPGQRPMGPRRHARRRAAQNNTHGARKSRLLR